jgi:K+ transporter
MVKKSGAHDAKNDLSGRRLAQLSLSLEVFFGDIGTRPLYAIRERFHG